MTATKQKDGFDDFVEACDECGTDTPHQVEISILTENEASDNAEFSREPYRVATCRWCGETTAVRMNNA
ncbi:DUF7835 family putative zinc beta-ribbon protein [Haladaptatus salinisoli]|uniref:DUF7835 family putative zinc beta-ribbon protein n=1 Tax=Haladaptatus salinisoli TaxID=2884876 RepID=UPI001D0AD02C|nr:hypothetical protein [Haladaptatus salinisoli]